jgi:phosphomannomutase
MTANRSGNPACFKAYDIRGIVPDQLDVDLAYRIGLATARYLGAKNMVVGRDCRLSSAELCAALVRGLASMAGSQQAKDSIRPAEDDLFL